MITGMHALLYSTDPEADRAFLRDVLGFPWVDNGGGWLIFKLPPSEVAVHPGESASHELCLMCDDLDATLADLRGRGVEIVGETETRRYGIVAHLRLPGRGIIQIYEPRHALATEL